MAMADGSAGTADDRPENGMESGEETGPEAPPEKPGLLFYLALALIVVLVLMVVVINYPAAKANAGLSLTKTNWTLTSLIDRTGILVPAISGNDVTAWFGRDGRMGGSAGCSRYSALYTTKDYSLNLTLDPVAGVKCWDPAVAEQEEEFLSDLPKASSFRAGDSELTFYDSSGKTLLVFVPA